MFKFGRLNDSFKRFVYSNSEVNHEIITTFILWVGSCVVSKRSVLFNYRVDKRIYG